MSPIVLVHIRYYYYSYGSIDIECDGLRHIACSHTAFPSSLDKVTDTLSEPSLDVALGTQRMLAGWHQSGCDPVQKYVLLHDRNMHSLDKLHITRLLESAA